MISQSNSILFVATAWSSATVKPSNSLLTATYSCLPPVGVVGVISILAFGLTSVVKIVTWFLPVAMVAEPADLAFMSEMSTVISLVWMFWAVIVPFVTRLPFLSMVMAPAPMSTRMPQ